LKLLLVLWIL